MRRTILPGAAALLLALGPWPTLPAQRRPVLPQVRVPHSYYYRESYLPQLTSGPGAATWSPDGKELVYPMQGSLWRQDVAGDLAVQLTDGPGYHHQPDWSPDGRWVAFVSYANDAMQLRLLELATGAVTTLVDDGAVNVEPRWSPRGDRLAWVSTAHQGRWHVFVADFADGRLRDARRVTDDRESALPRYYYSTWDHYLSPSWSPDGRQLLLVSNRGRTWGSGGFWRVEARPGGAMQEVHFEETTWRARPDWSRDGRVVWSSYLGRQWNQLWLLSMRAHDGAPRDGAPLVPPDAFQLTYGDFDATGPRWSPDGRAIAYVSNEAGNTSLWTITVPGGARRAIVPRRRRRLGTVGILRLVVSEAGRPGVLPARLSVRATDGRHFAPDDRWVHADDGFDRRDRAFEFSYFHADSAVEVTMPAGAATVEVQRGIEYLPVTRTVQVRAGTTTTARVTLRRLDDPASRGWVAGDLHVHMNYGGTYRNTPDRLARQARAEGLRVVENLVVNKEGRIPDVGSVSGPVRYPGGVIIAHDQEFHTSFWGHAGLLGLGGSLILPGYAAYAGTAAASLVPLNGDVMRLARARGAVAGFVHPFDRYPDPADTSRPLTHSFPVDVAAGLVDYYEVVGFHDDPEATQRVWYQALNCGFRIAAGAGTDAMANYASLRGPVGMNRVYVKVRGGALTHRTFLDGLASGRTFATNGPLLDFALDGSEPGAQVDLPAGRHALVATVRLRSMVPMDDLEVVRNGEVIATVPLSPDRRSADARLTVDVPSSGWYLLRARSREARHPVLDLMAYGTTSPVYVIVGKRPIRSAADARYFVQWIDRLRHAAEAFRDWNDNRERDHTLGRLAEARAEFERRIRDE